LIFLALFDRGTKRPQAAGGALGDLAAGLLTVADEQGVIFIEKPFLWGQVFDEKRLESAVAIARRGKT